MEEAWKTGLIKQKTNEQTNKPENYCPASNGTPFWLRFTKTLLNPKIE